MNSPAENETNNKKDRRRNPLKEAAILEAALEEFGKNGFESTTISSICKAANVSEATLYEYFKSKEEVLFSIPLHYTKREYDRMRQIERYIHGPREKVRVFIQAYLEFYESNPLYTSVAMLSLKANRNFLNSEAYQAIREATRPIVEAVDEGIKTGDFREDLDSRLVRNMVLGFIEHLTIQWLLTGRPESISALRDTVFEMIIRAIEKREPGSGEKVTD